MNFIANKEKGEETLNKVIMMGRLTRDPEITSSTSGTTFARFSIAVDRKIKVEGQPDADFFTCTSFGKQAEFVERYLKKGTKILITGRLQNDSYTNKDGQKVNATKIMTEEVEFAESKKDGQTEQRTENNDFLSIPDGMADELPFS